MVFSKPTKQREDESDLRAEIARLKRELKCAEQERQILKEAAARARQRRPAVNCADQAMLAGKWRAF
jgi:transposase-like protein